ncbi:MAG TPA: hypothetical protein VHR15_11215 [Ktedonobacterales bacterium]|jgi:hypothetical protein|nr:hypothetical protein [Ktedonobacterales bacterium]
MTTRWRAVQAVLLAALLGMLAACGNSAQGATGSSVSTPASAQPTATNAPITPSHNSLSCKDPAAVVAGDLRISPTGLGRGQQILQVPDSAPLKPLTLPVKSLSPHGEQEIPGWFSPAYDSPPDLLITICNTSASKAHVIESISVKFSAFAPYNGKLNVWNPCDGPYTRPAGVTPVHCGESGASYDEYVRATFAANAQVGAIAPAPLVDPSNFGQLGPLPTTLPPGQSMEIALFVNAPTAGGVYTFATGVTADKAALPFTVGQKVLVAPIGRHWTGKACLSPAMQAGIPANPPAGTYYICPES